MRLGTVALAGASQPGVPQPVPATGGEGAGGTTAGGATLPTLDVTLPGAPIAAPDPDPYASSDVGGVTVRLGKVALTSPAPVTADQLRAIMPHAGAAADRYVGALNRAMTAHGINTPEQRAAFLAQVSAETGQLRNLVEDLNYSARRIHEVWPRRFPTEAAAAPYAPQPGGARKPGLCHPERQWR